jgi:UDP-N-acetylmuramoyl-L-alanyl-D-glutamate--2,6-diaminopimelate ligase
MVESTTFAALMSDLATTSMSGPTTPVTGVAYRSDRVRPGDVFFCIPGFAHDGHDFAADAVRRGAVAVVVEREVRGLAAPVAVVASARAALARAAARAYEFPSRGLEVVGITGTNGKTTSVYLVDSILRADGRRSGLIGTVETRIAGELVASARTTPESADLQELLARMRAAGVSSVAMEVSSHAIDLHRVDGTHFAVAAFTNLSQDHLDYHHTLAEYWSVKRRLFIELDVASRVVNIDDPAGRELASERGDAITVGRDESASIRATDEVPGPVSTEFTIAGPWGTERLALPLAGRYNVENALVAAGCASALGIGIEQIAAGLSSAPQVPGRLERIEEGQPFSVFVDYAHTPDSLEKAILAVRAVTAGRVIVVFGCGGDRDPDKRLLMGAAAARHADHVIVTSDNPRSEDPVGIILQIEDGLRGTSTAYDVEVDRRAAISSALAAARPSDAVLIAGKGHEDYQIFSDRTVHFDDREIVREELRARC